ncbi:uncharacterized protein YpmB [Paenibacillus phyllosphaerae]|uniref:Uncharacterized protein YpmB n=1 Tax=Paenibacillus phyllosphaerae TaxID=274593 RepID=A0A7W5AV47_9BACL|nr:DUF5590 domain-containing protein [Paenibacillus phyllosphaerae]MBB3109325.1 uncharacterized protein YpmB [Paenibacillus phyllosphaerae]
MRTVRRKRKPFWTPVRIVLASVTGLLTIIIGINAYYWHVQSPFWEEENAAKSAAEQNAGLHDSSSAYKYVWDTTAWIVLGKDADGDAAIAWLPEEGGQPIIRKKEEGIARAELKEQFQQSKPDADLEHMQVGLLEGQPVWELFYSRDQAGVETYYYDFYRYNDGGYIITYNLPKQ